MTTERPTHPISSPWMDPEPGEKWVATQLWVESATLGLWLGTEDHMGHKRQLVQAPPSLKVTVSSFQGILSRHCCPPEMVSSLINSVCGPGHFIRK